MIRKEVQIVLITFCLTATLFSIIPVGSQGIREYDPWYDMNDDGIIDLWDVYHMNMKYGTTGTAINKTDLLLQLMTKIDQLNATIIEQQNTINLLNTEIIYLNQTVIEVNSTRGLGAPDYDSGWLSIAASAYTLLYHNLGTTELLVYVIGKDSEGSVHQCVYGGCGYGPMVDNPPRVAYEDGLFWRQLTTTSIRIDRLKDDGANGGVSGPAWDNVRVMLWKIPQP